MTGLATMALLLGSCEVLEPEVANVYTMEDVKSVVTMAEGVLLTAYMGLPTNHSNFTLAYGSDDAVTNNRDASVKSANEGGWTSDSNPFGVWNAAYENIMYINTFLEEMSDVEWWWKHDNVNDWYAERLKGEAFGLRAWYYFSLLQAHAGRGANGEMLGVPIVDHVLDPTDPDDYEVPRSTFNELVEFILADCDSAICLVTNQV